MPHCLSVALPLSPALLVLVLTSSPFILQAISLSLSPPFSDVSVCPSLPFPSHFLSSLTTAPHLS